VPSSRARCGINKGNGLNFSTMNLVFPIYR
jgi:hypothetical protein